MPDAKADEEALRVPVLVGTSGWQYRHWRGGFYPADVPQRRWLEYYAGQFGTVENNAAFYRLPARETFEQWRARTPDGFVMAVKASRYLTHIRRLREPAEPVRRMLDAFAGLGDRLGPVLIQLPPRLKADAELLDGALGQFPAGVRVAVEPRDASWWTDQIRAVLTARAAALCWADRSGEPVTPLWRTADWGYLRFHEGTADPWPRYAERALRLWAERVAATWPRSAPVYAYFNNDQNGAAVLDAADFARLTAEATLRRARRRHRRLPGAAGARRRVRTRPCVGVSGRHDPEIIILAETLAVSRPRRLSCWPSRACRFLPFAPGLRQLRPVCPRHRYLPAAATWWPMTHRPPKNVVNEPSTTFAR